MEFGYGTADVIWVSCNMYQIEFVLSANKKYFVMLDFALGIVSGLNE